MLEGGTRERESRRGRKGGRPREVTKGRAALGGDGYTSLVCFFFTGGAGWRVGWKAWD